MATASSIIDQAVRRLNELSTSAPVRWSRAELLVYLNDALAELNLIAADYQDNFNLAVNNTSAIWDLDGDVVGLLSVRASYGYLQRQSIEDLDKEGDWEITSRPRLKVRSYAPLGLKRIIINPVPLSPTTLVVEALAQYPAVADGATDLDTLIRPEYQRCLEDFIVSRAMFKEGGAEFAQAAPLYSKFLDTVQQLSQRNIVRRYPAWEVQPEAKPSQTTLRGD